MMTYLATALFALVLILLYVCRSLWLANRNTGLRDWCISLEKKLTDAQRLLLDQDEVLSQVGELLDHAGVDLERTGHKQASEDLKRLGAILRTRVHNAASSPFDLAWAQPTLAELGERYGIEPDGGGPYTIRKLVRIAEDIFETVLAARVPA